MYSDKLELYRVIDEDGRIVGTTETFNPLGEEKRRKIALVIGHDEKSQGAYGKGGHSEWRFNSELVQGILGQATNLNMKVFYRDENIGGYSNKMKDLHSRIDSWGAEISIELHFNGASNESVNGHEILYCSDNGKKIASVLDEKFDKYLKNKDRHLKKVTKKDRGGGFVCRGKSTCIIAEPFFSSHQDKYMMGTEGRSKLLAAYTEFLREVS